MPVHTLTLRLDEETNEALADRRAEEPKKPIAEIIREAILERGACVYFVRRSDGAVKIGFTGSLRTRLTSLKSEYGDVKLEALMPGGRAEEKAMHKRHGKARLARTEWFRGPSVEAEIRSQVEAWGPSAVEAGPMAFRTIGVRLPESAFKQLMTIVDERNVAAEAQGLPPATPAWVARTLIESGLRGPLPPLTEDTLKKAWDRAVELAVSQGEDVEKLLADAARNVDAWRAHEGPMGADEVVTSQPTHRKRVRAPIPSVVPPELPPPELPAPSEVNGEGVQDASEGASEGDDDLAEAEALLRGTPL